jgi:molecular chaperone HscB
MVDPFDTLGITPTFDVDLASVEKQYRELARVLHPDRHLGGSPAERRLSLGKAVEVNEAWRLVRDPIRRAEALLRRHGVRIEEGKEPKADPEFLMEMMEQREALSEARAGGDPAAVQRLASAIQKRHDEVLARIAAAFATSAPQVVGSPNGGASLEKVVSLLGELRYYRRFLDEVSAIEDGFSEKASAPFGD